MHSAIRNTRRIQVIGLPSTFNSRITYLENNVYKVTYYEIISGASGTLTVPTGATINAGEFSGSNCVLSEIDGSNKVTWVSPETAGGTVVTATLNTGTGAWTMSGTPTSANVALLYSVNIAASDYQNLNNFYIIEAETLSRIKGSVDAIAGLIPFGNGTADTIMSNTNFLFDNTNVGLIIGDTALPVATDVARIRKNQNAATAFRINNTTSGTSAQSFLQLGDGTDAFNFGFTNTSFTPSGVITAKTAYLQGTGTGGLVLQATNASGAIQMTTGGSTVRLNISSAGVLTYGTSAASSQHIFQVGSSANQIILREKIGTTTQAAFYIGVASGSESSTNYTLNYNGNLQINSQSTTTPIFLKVGDSSVYGISPTNSSATAHHLWSQRSRTSLTASTAVASYYFGANTQQWATGALTLQSFAHFLGNTVGFVGASTVTYCANLQVDSPIAGAAATITNKLAAIFNGSVSIGNSTAPTLGSGDGVMFIANAGTNPSTDPTSGGILYVDAGALKYRGSSGTITTLGVA